MMMENERNRQMQNRRVWEWLKDSDVAIQVLLFGAGKEQEPCVTWHQSPATTEVRHCLIINNKQHSQTPATSS
jgi:hypothetical protein